MLQKGGINLLGGCSSEMYWNIHQASSPMDGE